jgi:tetratricopeptide (TPR) repeat protein
MKYSILFLLLLCFGLSLEAQLNYRRNRIDRSGRREWSNENYEVAEQYFRENAIENPGNGLFHFNRGTALYRLEEHGEALREFQRALNDRNFEQRDQVFHNMGNIAFGQQEYAEAKEMFRRSMIENPNNHDSRINFELSRQLLEQQMGGGEGDGDDGEDEQDQQDREDQDDDNDEQQQPQQQLTDQELDDIERLLQALEQKQEQERDREEEQTGPGRRYPFW